MASNDLGPAPELVGTPATADDAIRGDAEVRSTGKGSVVELNAKPVAPDQFDDRYETGKYELWAYYSYYIGNNVSAISCAFASCYCFWGWGVRVSGRSVMVWYVWD